MTRPLELSKICLAACALAALGLAGLTASCAPNAAAANKAMSAAVLSKAGPGSGFADASTRDYAAIRHVASGMLCVLPHDGAFDFQAFPASAQNAGAYCASASNHVATTYLVVQFKTETTLDQAFADGLAQSAANAAPKPWAGQPSAADRASPEGLPHFRIARFEAAINGEPAYLRVAMGEVQGWYLQQIVSAPLSQADAVEAKAGEAFRLSLRAFQAAHSTSAR